MIESLGRVLPIILLFSLGIMFKKRNYMSADGIKLFKKFVVDFALPSVLFITFYEMDFKLEYLTLMFLMLLLYSIILFAGKYIINRFSKISHIYNPFMSTGYAFGLVGVPLYTIIHGEENMGIFSIMGLANEIFVWTVYYATLKVTVKNEKFTAAEMLKLVKSPLILSIVFGLLLNVTGAREVINEWALWQGLLTTVNYLSTVSTPLILIAIGYGISFDIKSSKPILKFLFSRYVLNLVIGILFKILVIDNLIEPSKLLDNTYIAFLLLPPLMSFALLITDCGKKEDEEAANGGIAVMTVINIILFVSYALFIDQ